MSEARHTGIATEKPPLSLLKKIGLDGFILALLGMIILAWLWPEGGLERGGFSLSKFAGYGVSLIFFFYGLRLNPQQLKAGLGHWRLHLLVHLSTFVLFPLIVLCFKWTLAAPEHNGLWLGVFFLAALPSTVSSSVVMVSIARGNMAAAIFNASISSLLGIFITPLWMRLELDSVSSGVSLGDTFTKLIVQVLIPVIAGILLHKKFGASAERNKKLIKYFDQFIILIIVYTSFADSFLNDRFTALTLPDLLMLTAALILLFFVVYFVISKVSDLLRFNRADKTAAVFCGSKKSLVHGTVMAKVLFTGSPYAGIILLPVMIYHAAQLIMASIIARKLAQMP